MLNMIDFFLSKKFVMSCFDRRYMCQYRSHYCWLCGHQTSYYSRHTLASIICSVVGKSTSKLTTDHSEHQVSINFCQCHIAVSLQYCLIADLFKKSFLPQNNNIPLTKFNADLVFTKTRPKHIQESPNSFSHRMKNNLSTTEALNGKKSFLSTAATFENNWPHMKNICIVTQQLKHAKAPFLYELFITGCTVSAWAQFGLAGWVVISCLQLRTDKASSLLCSLLLIESKPCSLWLAPRLGLSACWSRQPWALRLNIPSYFISAPLI